MIRKFSLSYLWIALLVSALVVLTDHKIIPGAGTWNILELRTIDLRFMAKPQPVSDHAKDIALIVIDENSYKKINKPLILYHTYISEIIDHLVKSGAKVIGLDIELPSISLEGMITGGYDSLYTRSLLKARKEGTDVVIGFSSSENPPLQVYLRSADREGKNNVSYFGLTEDVDDTIRRQQLFFEDGGKQCESFPYTLAKKYLGAVPATREQTILIDYTLAQTPKYSLYYDVYRSIRPDTGPDMRFKDKVVIIGLSLPFLDEHSIPLRYLRSEHKMTPGVIIQAATLNTLLSRSIFHEPTYASQAFYIFIVSVLAVLLCFNRKPIPAACLCLAEALFVASVSVYAFNHLYVIRIIPLFSAVLLAYLSTTVFHYYTEERKRIKIRERFASYVPEKIIDTIVDMDIEKLTEGELREVVLLFCDIRGFSTYSEKNKDDPKKIVAFLNLFHKEMTEIILSNEGTVAQLVGDGIFAFFGAPVPLADPVFCALSSAVGMRDKVIDLKSKWQEYGVADLRIGIGVHVGDAIVGNIGSIKKMYYSAIGDNTNIASRIEGLTKEFKETILMSKEAYDRVKDKVAARPLGLAKIKGHSEVEIFAIDGFR